MSLKQDLKECGYISASEYQREKNQALISKAKAEESIRRLINVTGEMSDCCGSAVLKNRSGDDVCADCCESCDVVKI